MRRSARAFWIFISLPPPLPRLIPRTYEEVCRRLEAGFRGGNPPGRTGVYDRPTGC